MGKGRRLTFSGSERFLGNHQQSGECHVDVDPTVELELMEEDVWSVIESDEQTEPSAWTPRYHDGERRQNRGRVVDGNQAVTGEGRRKRHVSASAPVKVPDWSKILKVESIVSMHGNYHDDDVADDDLESEMVPPHEYVARGRNGDGGSSVFLGVGRTLKGRDMRRVRDAVWSQTGFYG